VTDWSVIFLAVVAIATITMAIIQVGAIIYASRLARRVDQLLGRVEQDLQPLIGRATAVVDDAASVAAMAKVQAERVDGLLTEVTGQVERSLDQMRSALVSPAREGLALLSGLRAAIAALRNLEARRRREKSVEEDDALFIG
jgi:uncharacterized membrane protein